MILWYIIELKLLENLGIKPNLNYCVNCKSKNDIVTIKLSGACVTCSLADQTYKDGMEELLRDEVDPNIKVEMII